ncbi:MAG: queuosine precursor transporter [Rhodobacteraceae bacterium]|nr:queuosine precursor transporter [Paracoccaceae bacterium]
MNFPVMVGIAAMALTVVASNILVQFLVGQWLTWGAFVYPIAFLVTDLMNRVFGLNAARKVILAGFLAGILCCLVGSQIEGEFGPLVTLRIAVGSGTAFLIAQFLDVSIFDRLRKETWWKAPLVSTLIGSTVDTFLFFFIAFSSQLTFLEPTGGTEWANEPTMLLGLGPELPYWTSLATADLGVKLTIALFLLIPFRTLSRKLVSQ